MKKILVVVDMQNDFITGPLGTPEAVSIVDKVVEKIRGEEWDYIFSTQDGHYNDDVHTKYSETQEGRKLPIEHCIVGSNGWDICDKVWDTLNERDFTETFKQSFGDKYLPMDITADIIKREGYFDDEEFELTLVGVCTDICVISNALLLKAHYPEMKIVVDASGCAGSTPIRHQEALDVMRSCQIDIINNTVTSEYMKSLHREPYDTVV